MTTPRRCEIEGLDLVLKGGIVAIRKLIDDRQSTLILVRGGTGTGKTIFASQLALDTAGACRGDVVVGLVEMLPSELEGQLAGIQLFDDGPVCFVSPKSPVTPTDAAPCMLAAILDDAALDLGEELHQLLKCARDRGLTPKVLLIDAVSRGYRLGENVPRAMIDGLSKFAAEQSLIVIVVEETEESSRESMWPWVADVVFELAIRQTENSFQHALIVRKSRFNESSIGPHTLNIRSHRGVEIVPFWQSEVRP